MIDKNSKVYKYVKERRKGKSKKESALSAGYSITTATSNPHAIEKTQSFQVVERHFSDALKDEITIPQIAQKLASNILQDVSIPASNQAIMIAKEILEPNEIQEKENVVILLQ